MKPKYKVGDTLVNKYSGIVIKVKEVKMQTTEIWYYFDGSTSVVAFEEKILRPLTKLERALK